MKIADFFATLTIDAYNMEYFKKIYKYLVKNLEQSHGIEIFTTRGSNTLRLRMINISIFNVHLDDIILDAINSSAANTPIMIQYSSFYMNKGVPESNMYQYSNNTFTNISNEKISMKAFIKFYFRYFEGSRTIRDLETMFPDSLAIFEFRAHSYSDIAYIQDAFLNGEDNKSKTIEINSSMEYIKDARMYKTKISIASVLNGNLIRETIDNLMKCRHDQFKRYIELDFVILDDKNDTGMTKRYGNILYNNGGRSTDYYYSIIKDGNKAAYYISEEDKLSIAKTILSKPIFTK